MSLRQVGTFLWHWIFWINLILITTNLAIPRLDFSDGSTLYLHCHCSSPFSPSLAGTTPVDSILSF